MIVERELGLEEYDADMSFFIDVYYSKIREDYPEKQYVPVDLFIRGCERRDVLTIKPGGSFFLP